MDATSPLNQQVAEIEVTYRNTVTPENRIKVTLSQECYELLKSIWSDKIEYVEEFYIVLLNKAHHVLGISKISEGSMSGCIVDPKRIFQVALKSNAACVILSHNHPSSQVNPSGNDRQITQKVHAAGKLLDIDVLDHLIITPESYFSFADSGEL